MREHAEMRARFVVPCTLYYLSLRTAQVKGNLFIRKVFAEVVISRINILYIPLACARVPMSHCFAPGHTVFVISVPNWHIL